MKTPGAPRARVVTPAGRQWGADFRWAAGIAGFFAAAYSALILVETVLNRSTYWPKYHMTTWRILASYWSAAALIAVILGVLRPLLGRRRGAALGGFLGGAAVYGVIGLFASNAPEPNVDIGFAVLGGLIGLGVGIVIFDRDHGERMSEEREGRRIAIMIAGAIVLIFLTWAMTYPPLCWLGGKYCNK